MEATSSSSEQQAQVRCRRRRSDGTNINNNNNNKKKKKKKVKAKRRSSHRGSIDMQPCINPRPSSLSFYLVLSVDGPGHAAAAATIRGPCAVEKGELREDDSWR